MFKYIKLLAGWQDVQDTYRQEKGKDRPIYLSRKLIGSVIGLLGVFLHVQFGIAVDEATQISLIDNFEKLFPALMVVYGSGMAIVSIVKNLTGGKK